MHNLQLAELHLFTFVNVPRRETYTKVFESFCMHVDAIAIRCPFEIHAHVVAFEKRWSTKLHAIHMGVVNDKIRGEGPPRGAKQMHA